MSQSARKRGGNRRIQPYTWLGAGAVTLGMGVALVGGTAVAFADTGAESTGATSTSESAGAAGAASAKSDTVGPRRKALRPSRSAAADADGSAGSTAPRLRAVWAVSRWRRSFPMLRSILKPSRPRQALRCRPPRSSTTRLPPIRLSPSQSSPSPLWPTRLSASRRRSGRSGPPRRGRRGAVGVRV